MIYAELKQIFQELKQTSPRDDLTAHIVFTEDSFTTQYALLSRTYCVSSDNKGFRPHMFSNSIFAYCLDVTSDQGVRLDWYMAEEGNPDGEGRGLLHLGANAGRSSDSPFDPDGTGRWNYLLFLW